MVSLSLFLILSSKGCTSFENKAKTPQQVVPISGDSTIKAGTGSKQIVVTTTSRLAGAIHSITYNGKEYMGINFGFHSVYYFLNVRKMPEHLSWVDYLYDCYFDCIVVYIMS
jgi:hypothetical protein